MAKKKIIPKFNVIHYNFNTQSIEPYDVIARLVSSFNYCKRRKFFTVIESDEKTSITTKTVTIKKASDLLANDKLVKHWVKGQLMYMFWGKCEYEMIISSWPPMKDSEVKVDIYEQCMMNFDLIVELFKQAVK